MQNERLNSAIIGKYGDCMETKGTNMEWQPIETAPKDGTVVQGWVEVEHDLDGFSSYWVPEIIFHDNEWQYKHSQGWFGFNNYLMNWRTKRLTHWMPLPPPPTE